MGFIDLCSRIRFMILNENKFVCRAIDNRMGGFMIAEIGSFCCMRNK
jgi:putative aminopeptidase FrvX